MNQPILTDGWYYATVADMRDANLKATTEIVDAVLREHLGAAGFSRAIVSEGRDPDGEPILTIRSVFGAGRTPLKGIDSIRAIHEVRRALLRSGETRFPHIVHELPEDRAA